MGDYYREKIQELTDPHVKQRAHRLLDAIDEIQYRYNQPLRERAREDVLVMAQWSQNNANLAKAVVKDVLGKRNSRVRATAGTPVTDEMVEQACAAFYPNWHQYSASYRQAKHTRWAKALRAVTGGAQ